MSTVCCVRAEQSISLQTAREIEDRTACAQRLHTPTPCNRTHLRGVDLLKVLGHVDDALRHLVLVEVVAPGEPSPQRERRGRAAAAAGRVRLLLQGQPNVAQQAALERLHRARERHGCVLLENERTRRTTAAPKMRCVCAFVCVVWRWLELAACKRQLRKYLCVCVVCVCVEPSQASAALSAQQKTHNFGAHASPRHARKLAAHDECKQIV